MIGGDSWADVQRYAGIRSQPPTTIKQWYAVAEAMYRKARQNGR